MNRLLILALVLTNLAWVALTVNRAVAADQQADHQRRQDVVIRLMAQVMIELRDGRGSSGTAAALRKSYPDLPIKEQGDTVEVGDIRLHFDGTVLSRVSTF